MRFRVERTSHEPVPEEVMAFESLEGLLEWITAMERVTVKRSQAVILCHDTECDPPWGIEIYDGWRE